MRHKCPEISPWLDQLLSAHPRSPTPSAERIRQAELKILNCINDLVVSHND
jgi:hypothetical protein